MSILSALKQHNGSIDDLAKLPQAMIMQMAQRKEISPEMVAPILSRKAQMQEAVARTKSLQTQPGQTPSVMERLMQKNAEAEQPTMTDGRDMGIANNPIPERNYAGGGIVAFAGGGPAWNDLPDVQQNPNEWRGLLDVISSTYNPKKINPITGKPVTQAEYESIATKAQAPAPATLPSMPTNVKTDELGRADAAKQDGKPVGIKALPTAQAVTKPAVETQQPNELQALLAQARSDIEGSKSATEKAREEAKWSRLLEAGLGIMGGESTNFAQNIGRGATQAAKGYAEDVKGLRTEDADRQKQLTALGLKGYELGQGAKKAAAEEAYMKSHGKYFEQMGAAAGARGNLAGNADKVDIAALKVGLDNAQKALLTAKKADKPAIQQQINAYVSRINSLAGVGGPATAAPTIAGGGTTFNYVPGKGLIPVQQQ